MNKLNLFPLTKELSYSRVHCKLEDSNTSTELTYWITNLAQATDFPKQE